MKLRYLLFVLIASTTGLSAGTIEEAMKAGNVKFAIQSLQYQLSNKPADKGAVEAKLAIAYFKDQDQEKAFSYFLEALADVVPAKAPALTEDDKKTYEEALKMYLDVAKLTPQEIAERVEEKYGKIFESNPNNYLLGYVLSLAYANLDEFDRFFDLFYQSYKVNPEHFLAYKTKAILHIKLLERAKTPEDREKERQAILSNIQKAQELYPQDTSLYKLAIVFAPEKNKDQVLVSSIDYIIGNNIIVPRVDIPFYVQEGIDASKYDLIQKFITKAREWYTVSRVLDAAQQYLDQHKGS